MITSIISRMDFRPFSQGTIISYFNETLQRFSQVQFTDYALVHDMWDTAPQNALDYSGRAHWGRSKRYAVAVPHTLPHIQDKYR